MAEIGDVFEEFHNAKPPEKMFIIVAVLAVAGVGFYIYKRKGVSSSGTQTTDKGNNSAYPEVQSGGVGYPLLPFGVAPIYNSSGSLVGYQQPPTPNPPSNNPPPPTNNPPGGHIPIPIFPHSPKVVDGRIAFSGNKNTTTSVRNNSNIRFQPTMATKAMAIRTR